MFTVMKVREDLAPGDYRDPGWYQHPQGTVARKVDVASTDAPQLQQPKSAGASEPGETPMHHHHQ